MYHKIKKEIFFKAFILEFLFLLIFVVAGKFFISKAYSIILIIQSFQNNLNQYQNFDIDNATLTEINELRGVVSDVTNSINQLIIYIILFTIILFITYNILHSIQWNLIYNEKVTNYKRYLAKFTTLNIFFSIITIILSFSTLKYGRTFLIGYLFENSFLYEPFIKLLILFLLYILIAYSFFTGYIFFNKYSFLQSLKEIIKFRKFYLFFILIIIFLMSSIIIRYGLIISSSLISLIIQGIIISIIFVWYKLYMVNKIKTN